MYAGFAELPVEMLTQTTLSYLFYVLFIYWVYDYIQFYFIGLIAKNTKV